MHRVVFSEAYIIFNSALVIECQQIDLILFLDYQTSTNISM